MRGSARSLLVRSGVAQVLFRALHLSIMPATRGVGTPSGWGRFVRAPLRWTRRCSGSICGMKEGGNRAQCVPPRRAGRARRPPSSTVPPPRLCFCHTTLESTRPHACLLARTPRVSKAGLWLPCLRIPSVSARPSTEEGLGKDVLNK